MDLCFQSGAVLKSGRRAHLRSGCGQTRRVVRAAVSGNDINDGPVVGFRTREDSKTRKLIGKESEKPKTKAQIILDQIQETRDKLGVQDPAQAAPRPQPKRVDLSKISAVNGFGASALSAGMTAALVYFTMSLIQYYGTEPFQSDIYVVQRLYAVVRTAMLTLFALATGITGVTTLGIFALSCQVAYMRLTGRFDDK